LKSTGGRPEGESVWLMSASYTPARAHDNPEVQQGARDVFKCCDAA
jgi:hypothetical protein